jgi:hypothetical protein
MTFHVVKESAMFPVFPRTLRTLLCAAGALALVACGGDDDEAAADVPLAAEVSISQANATRVAAEALGSLQASFFVRADVLVEPEGANAVLAARSAARAAAARVLGTPRLGIAGVRPLLLVDQEVACTDSGTLTVTISTASELAATPGDFFQIAFNQCAEAGVTFNGSVRETLVAFNAEGTLLTLDVAATNLSITVAGRTLSADGTARVAVDFTDVARPASTTTSDRIAGSRSVDGVVVSSYSVSDLQRQEALDIAAGQFILDTSYVASGTFPVLGDVSFKVETPAPLVLGGTFFISGQVRITGAGNTSVLITAAGDGSGSVLLQLDSDGDGAVDLELSITLAELLAEFDIAVPAGG